MTFFSFLVFSLSEISSNRSLYLSFNEFLLPSSILILLRTVCIFLVSLILRLMLHHEVLLQRDIAKLIPSTRLLYIHRHVLCSVEAGTILANNTLLLKESSQVLIQVNLV